MDDNTEKYKILIVDDEEIHRENYIRFFSRIGHEAISAYDGLNALGILKKMSSAEMPNCIVLDINMPRMDGFEFLARIKSDDQYKHCRDLKVFVLTAKTSDETRDKAFELGIDQYMRKTEIRRSNDLLEPVLNLCRKHQAAISSLQEIEKQEKKIKTNLKSALIGDRSKNIVLRCFLEMPFPGIKTYAKIIHIAMKETYGFEGAVYIRNIPTEKGGKNSSEVGENYCYTERSDLFEKMLVPFLDYEKGITHNKGYSVIISGYIAFLAIGFPEEASKKQLLAEIVESAIKEFEKYIIKSLGLSP